MAQTHAEIARRLHRSQAAMYAAAHDLIREAALGGTADDLRGAVDTAAKATGRDRVGLIVMAGSFGPRFSEARAARVRVALTAAGLLPVQADA